MRVFPYKLFFVGLVGIFILSLPASAWAAPSSVVRNGIIDESGTLWTDGSTGVPVDGYFKWQHLKDAGSYVLRIKKIDSKIDFEKYKLQYPTLEEAIRAYRNDACAKEFPSDEDSIPIPSPGDPVLVWFLGLTIGTIQHADTYCWKVRADFEPDTVFSNTPWWAFSTEQEPVVGLPPGTPPPGTPPPGDGDGETPIDPSKLNPISAQNITELFNKIFSFLFGLAIFIVPVIVIYAAFLMLMGGGDPVKLQKGRMILFWTAVAFIIILLSRGLPVVFKNLL
jgi:hypothetical protein